MLAFGLCSHGLAETVDGDLKVAFSDQLYSLEKLLKKKLKTNLIFLYVRDSMEFEYQKFLNKLFFLFQFFTSLFTDAEN